ncbi:MAG: hypothetical protein HQL37_09660 [Alphaproteobacteria bacterium]|nr:hypothetical protein [Alphaproteobacteria bacterium]
MSLPAKPILTLAEAAAGWNVTPRDVACYALDDNLTLSVVVKDIQVEEGEYVENYTGEWHFSSYGERSMTGILDVYGYDIWPVFQNDNAIINRFKTPNGAGRLSICDTNGLSISSSDLVLRHEEYIRFAQKYDLPVARGKAQGGPGLKLQYDWDAFWIRAFKRFYNDGFPSTQAALVRELIDWFSIHYESCPDTSTVKKKISRLWKELQIS